MELVGHGGECCGIQHIHNITADDTVETFDRLLALHFPDNNNNRVVEVVLSERQVTHGQDGDTLIHPTILRRPGRWASVLRERGFRLVSRFNNSNSGRVCYIFHKTTTWLPLRNEDLPFNWPAAHGRTAPGAPPIAPLPLPPVVVATTYHNVYLTGRVGAGFDTYAAAREAAPRCQRVDRRRTMSDGEVIITERVTAD